MANSPVRQVVDVGTVIAETYTIEALIGRGGMGSVFLASHRRLPGKQVAIKMLHADLQDPEVIARFKREAEIASRLGHPNIVGVHDFNVLPDGTPYLILEYLHGESLAARLREGPLPLETVFSIARQVGSALAVAHREGIVHRDLKPQNIFLVPTEVDGKIVEIAKVLDFGISKMRGSTTVKTQESTLLGTPQYMAPEQAKGDHANVDQRTDIFALGSIIYEMLAGHPAFSGDNIPEVCFKVVYEQPRPLIQEAPATPPSVIESVTQAMAKVPAERFDSVSSFIEKLTGERLASPSKPGISLPPPDGPQDAYAKTMNSGEFGIAASTPRPRLPTPIPVVEEAAANPQGATMESLPPPVRPEAPVARRALAPVIGIALAGAAVGALVLYLVTREGSTPAADATRPPDAEVIAVAPPADAARAQPPDAEVAKPEPPADAAAPVVDAVAPVVVDAAVRLRPDGGRIVVDPGGGDENAPPHGDVLKQAAAALAARDYATAERQSGAVFVSRDANPRQKARARAIHAVTSCLLRFDEETARLDVKAIPAGYRAYRKQAIDACQRAGYLHNMRP